MKNDFTRVSQVAVRECLITGSLLARRWLRDTFAPALEEHLTVKLQIIGLIGISALAGCALSGREYSDSAAVPVGTAAKAVQSTAPHGVDQSDGFASAALANNSYEVTYSGPWRGSRDEIEGALLYRAALLADRHGKSWFRFLHMPGERGPRSHPSRQSPSFGAAYGHWQPHWSYQTDSSWQPWHPEWGSPFWAETLDGAGAARVQVHAMIELGQGPFAAAEQTDFDVSAVLRDLRPSPK